MRLGQSAAWLLACVLVSASGRAAEPQPPAHYPTLDTSRMRVLLLVGDVDPGGPLPLAECRDGSHICLDEPFWVWLRVREVVSGNLEERRIPVVTSSHYGLPRARADEAYLMEVWTDGQTYLTPRYHWSVLRKRADENRVLIKDGPIEWLPCQAQQDEAGAYLRSIGLDRLRAGLQPASNGEWQRCKQAAGAGAP